MAWLNLRPRAMPRALVAPTPHLRVISSSKKEDCPGASSPVAPQTTQLSTNENPRRPERKTHEAPAPAVFGSTTRPADVWGKFSTTLLPACTSPLSPGRAPTVILCTGTLARGTVQVGTGTLYKSGRILKSESIRRALSIIEGGAHSTFIHIDN